MRTFVVCGAMALAAWGGLSDFISPSSGSASAATYLDPATATLPSPCAYHAKSALRPGPEVACWGCIMTLTGLDFTLHNSVWLHVTVPSTCSNASLTIANSQFRAGPTTMLANGDLIHIDPTTAPLTRQFTSLSFNGAWYTGAPGTMEAVRQNACNGSETWSTVSFTNIPGRPVSDAFGECATAGHNVFTAKYVTLSGMTLADTGDHGELFEFGKSQAGAVPVEMSYSHMTLTAPAHVASNTALLWLGSGDPTGPLNIDVVTIDSSTFTALMAPGNVRTVSRLIGTATANINRLAITNSHFSMAGAYYCVLNDGAHIAQVQWGSDVNALTNQAVANFSARSGTC